MGRLTSEQIAVISKRLDDAGIPSIYRKWKLTDLGRAGKELRGYLEGNNYSDDKLNGMGLYIYGSGEFRVMSLPIFAKELVLSNDGVRLISLNQLISLLKYEDTDDGTLLQLQRTNALCISWFEIDIKKCPFDYYDRSLVEHFIVDRKDQGLRNYFSACRGIKDTKWWSKEFVDNMYMSLRIIRFGSKNVSK